MFSSFCCGALRVDCTARIRVPGGIQTGEIVADGISPFSQPLLKLIRRGDNRREPWIVGVKMICDQAPYQRAPLFDQIAQPFAAEILHVSHLSGYRGQLLHGVVSPFHGVCQPFC